MNHMKDFEVNIIADSIADNGNRITTFSVKYPFVIHAEVMTHRVFSRNFSSCLSGDTLLYFEKPCNINKGINKCISQKVTIKEFYNKWINGDSLGRTMLHRLKYMHLRNLNEDTGEFETTTVSNVIFSGIKPIYEIELEDGYKIKCTKEHRIFSENGWVTLNDFNLEFSKGGILNYNKELPKIATNGRKIYEGETFEYLDKDWLLLQRQSGHTTSRIAEMCNTKEHKVKAAIKKYRIIGFRGKTKEFTPWNKGKTYQHTEEAKASMRKGRQQYINSKKGSYLEMKTKNMARTRFLNVIREEIMQKFNYKCVLTGLNKNLELHHIIPVWYDDSKQFEKDNIIPVTKKIHKLIHKNNLDIEFMNYYLAGNDPYTFIELYENLKLKATEIGKFIGSGNRLVAKYLKIISIKYIGEEETYDIEVTGKYKNFVANGIVVHNSRAIPSKKMLFDDPYIPYSGLVYKNTKGMQGKELIDMDTYYDFYNDVNSLYNISKLLVKNYSEIHKQHVNRYLQPFSHMQGIITATELTNFFNLRVSELAQPEIHLLAKLMKTEYELSEPTPLTLGGWHIPFILSEENKLDLTTKLKISSARCARISYLNHGNTEISHEKDIELADSLLNNMHMSPFEHCAMVGLNKYYSNIKGFISFRKFIEEGLPLSSELILHKWINSDLC